MYGDHASPTAQESTSKARPSLTQDSIQEVPHEEGKV